MERVTKLKTRAEEKENKQIQYVCVQCDMVYLAGI